MKAQVVGFQMTSQVWRVALGLVLLTGVGPDQNPTLNPPLKTRPGPGRPVW